MDIAQVGESAWYDEAVEMDSDDPLEDLALFASVIEEIRGVMQKVAQMKSKTPEKWKEAAQELRLEGSFHFLTLKKLNRMAQIRCKNMKDMTLESKQKLDENNLRLQNLQYEISHLDREVNSCLQFKSKHEDIDLVSVEEFYTQAPEEISKEDETTTDAHLQTLARLDWELENRKRLADELKNTQDEKEKVCSRIKKRKQDLDSLRPCLESVLKSTFQLQDAFGDHITDTKILHDNARLLPRPLYVLFFQAKAFAEACDPRLEVLIEGDTVAARKMKQQSQRKVIDATEIYSSARDDSDSENEDDQETERGRRKSTSKAQSSMDWQSSSAVNDVSKHPLNVILKIFLKSKSSSMSHVCLKFSFYVDLEIVTVTPTLNLTEGGAGTENEKVLCPASLLHNLQQEIDRGDTFLNRLTANHSSKPSTKLEKNECAYVWVQKLAGLEILKDRDTNDMQTSYANVQVMIRLIRRRIQSRISLGMQLDKFSHNLVACDPMITSQYASTLHFKLASWKAVDFKVFTSVGHTTVIKELGLASPGDFFYFATVRRASATAEVAVLLPDQYPEKWPLFRIQLSWHGAHTAENDLNVREIEVDVNCRTPEAVNRLSKKLREQILSAQMHRLLSLLDIYVETDCAKDGGSDLPVEFAMNKLCPRLVKGRARLKPFKYDQRHKFQSY